MLAKCGFAGFLHLCGDHQICRITHDVFLHVMQMTISLSNAHSFQMSNVQSPGCEFPTSDSRHWSESMVFVCLKKCFFMDKYCFYLILQVIEKYRYFVRKPLHIRVSNTTDNFPTYFDLQLKKKSSNLFVH